MENEYTIIQGGIIGRYHLMRRENYQDAIRSTETDRYIIGVVCDGCGSGDFSEVGSNLLSGWMLDSLVMYIKSNLNLENMIQSSIDRTVNKIHLLTNISYNIESDRQKFVENHMLATILGVVIDKKTNTGLAFSIGDGTIVIDDYIHEINQNNAPMYLSYVALNQPYKVEYYPIESGFERVGLLTDGVEIDRLDKLFNTNKSVKLQRFLNQASEYDQAFFDDATCFLVKRSEDETDNYTK